MQPRDIVKNISLLTCVKIVNKCLQVGYAGVVQEKLERWPKIDWDQCIFGVKNRGRGKVMYTTDTP